MGRGRINVAAMREAELRAAVAVEVNNPEFRRQANERIEAYLRLHNDPVALNAENERLKKMNDAELAEEALRLRRKGFSDAAVTRILGAQTPSTGNAQELETRLRQMARDNHVALDHTTRGVFVSDLARRNGELLPAE